MEKIFSSRKNVNPQLPISSLEKIQLFSEKEDAE